MAAIKDLLQNRVAGMASSYMRPASDRARAAVTQRIRNAIRKIEKIHPYLAEHFSQTIHTGTFCSYIPEKKLHWDP